MLTPRLNACMNIEVKGSGVESCAKPGTNIVLLQSAVRHYHRYAVAAVSLCVRVAKIMGICYQSGLYQLVVLS